MHSLVLNILNNVMLVCFYDPRYSQIHLYISVWRCVNKSVVSEFYCNSMRLGVMECKQTVHHLIFQRHIILSTSRVETLLFDALWIWLTIMWTTTNGHFSIGQPAKTYIHQTCKETECSLENLPEATDERDEYRKRKRERERERERESRGSVLSARLLDIYIYIIDQVVASFSHCQPQYASTLY